MSAAQRKAHYRDTSRVSLVTTQVRGHKHVATFNAAGNGHTDEAPDGHYHQVRECEVMAAEGHTHEITEVRAEVEPEVERRAHHP
jgi:hypothetical protein